MDVQLNTLFVVTRKSTIRQDHLTLKVEVEKVTKLAVPIHQLESVAVFGGVHVTPAAMALCAEHGVGVSFLTESGRLMARVDAPFSGNVLFAGNSIGPLTYRNAGQHLPRVLSLGKSITPGTCFCDQAANLMTKPIKPL